jgi:hypothetical protein
MMKSVPGPKFQESMQALIDPPALVHLLFLRRSFQEELIRMKTASRLVVSGMRDESCSTCAYPPAPSILLLLPGIFAILKVRSKRTSN